MTEELKQYYDKINSLWQSAKAGNEPAKIAIDLAELVVKYYDTSDISDPTWLRFAGDMQQIGDAHPAERSQMFLSEVAHSLMQMICKKGRGKE
jgi:hypothetical protein